MSLRLTTRASLMTAISLLTLMETASAADLNLTIVGASGPGKVYVKLFNDAKTFKTLGDAVSAAVLTPANGKATTTIRNLAPGRYAFAAFQDAQGTGKLETNALGVPSEPYGFSNDPSTSFGAPSFDAAAFTVGSQNLTVSFRLKR